MAKVAVVLSGCGVFDGSEIHEAVSTLIHLSRLGAEVHCFAPDIDQPSVVNHLTGQPGGERRNILVESARIARGNVQPLSECHASQFDAVVFPGGFGAAMNLCDFADKGPSCSVNPDVERVLHEFHDAGKPIGMCCIAPVIAAREFGSEGVTLTLGEESEASRAAVAMGARHQRAGVTEVVKDREHHLITTPAYMHGKAPIHQVFEGIGQMVEQTLAMAGVGAGA
ncbi:MAG: isoprenoid biosynthesis glyoxalase ElbB [Phycisphaeraceae bacterium]|nr:isoprenoid biosynthesis glyoxalase ElbB [Phycisphaeraceae bacterium]